MSETTYLIGVLPTKPILIDNYRNVFRKFMPHNALKTLQKPTTLFFKDDLLSLA